MDILWVALGICMVVFFVFYVLAQHWQRLLIRHSWTVRRLTERLVALEQMANPDFVRKLEDTSPSPLEQVFTFSLCLSDRFWKDTLQATPEDMAFIREEGTFLGSVKIERWRSHTVVTITEVLPQSKSATWQTRSLELFPDSTSGNGSFLTLWELPLKPANEASPGERAPAVELRLHSDVLALCARQDRSAAALDHGGRVCEDETVLVTVPLDTARLAEYRMPEETASHGGFEAVSAPHALTQREELGVAFYGHQDEARGVNWQLCLREVARREQWSRWKVIERGEIRQVN